MMARRWRFVFMLSCAMLILAYAVRVIRFYKHWYGSPVTFSRVVDAALAYTRGDWLGWLPGLFIVVGVAVNWAIYAKRGE